MLFDLSRQFLMIHTYQITISIAVVTKLWLKLKCDFYCKIKIIRTKLFTNLKYLYYVIYKYGKRYVPEKEYIHMISSYITADWSNIE